MTQLDLAEVFYGTKGPRTAKIMIVGESYGATEVKYSKPFVGESGQDLDRILAEVRLPVNNIFFTNVVNERPDANDMKNFFYTTKEAKANGLVPVRGLYPKPNVLAGLEKLRKQIELVNPELIICFGNWSLWALTEKSFSIKNESGYKVPTGIGNWRGSQLYSDDASGRHRLLPTYHPAAALRTYPWRYMILHDLRVRAPMAFDNRWDEKPYLFAVRPSFDDATQFILNILSRLDAGPTPVMLDLETRPKTFDEGGPNEVQVNLISTLGFGLNKDAAMSIPFMCVENNRGYWSSIEEEVFITDLIRRVFQHPNLQLWGQNLLFDVQLLWHWYGVLPKIHRDSMIMHHVMFPGGGDPKGQKQTAQGISRKALFNIASLYCEHYYYWKDEGKEWNPSIPEEQHWAYNCRDCVKTHESIEELEQIIAADGLTEQMEFQHQVANEMLIPMMVTGINQSKEQIEEDSRQLKKALDTFDEKLKTYLPDRLIPPGKKGSAPWYRSPDKLKVLFYETLGVSPHRDKKTGSISIGKEAFPIIARREPILHNLVEMIELRRSVGVYFNTFIKAKRDADNRLRCSYNLTGTDTFRLSSSENVNGTGTNLQNVPSGKTLEEDVELPAEIAAFEFPNVRKEFIPDIGYELAEFDLAGADAQVVAWQADDNDLKAAFRAGLKLHVKNARDVYPERTKDMTDEDLKASDHQGGLYHNCKRLVHGTNYVGSPKGIAERVIGVSVRDAEEFQERWFYLHPGIKAWHRRCERKLQGIQCWKCETMALGGEIRCRECRADLGRTIGNKFGFRIIYFDRVHELLSRAVAWEPQSTVGINCNKGALALRRRYPWITLLLQVHDSLIVQYPQSYSERLGDVKETLHSIVVPFADPLVIPWGVKVSRKSWGDAEQIKW